MNKNIGFAGLGNMGKGMASRLLKAGYSVQVYNRTQSKAQELVDKGATLAKSPRDLSKCDVVLTMLADDHALEAVVMSESGFGGVIAKGATHIAMGTISVDFSRELARYHEAKGQRYVAAPVLGRPDAAQAGQLVVLAAGLNAQEFEPLFSALGKRTVILGDEAHKANLTKIAFNFMLGSAVEVMSEAFALVRKGGIEAQTFYDIFTESLFNCPVYKNYGDLILKEKYDSEGGMKLSLAAKDFKLALAAADDLKMSLPTASIVRNQMMQAIGRGYEDLDWAGLAKLSSENAGL